MILYNHCVVILMLLCCLNWQLCCDTIQSLCGDINVTLAVNWELCCDNIESLCGDINVTLQ